LLEHGADPNIADSDGDLPIIGSIDQRAMDEIELLIAYGTDLNHKNRAGETPLDRAKIRGIFDAVVALKNE
jgi:ankyrin repeat protein